MSNQKQEITIREFATKLSNCFFLEPECETLAEELRCLNLNEIPSVLMEKDFGFTKEQFEEAWEFFKTSKIKKIDVYDRDVYLAIYVNTVYDEMRSVLTTLLYNFVNNPEFSDIAEVIKHYILNEDYNDVSTFFSTHKTWKKPIEDWDCLLNELDKHLGIHGEADF